ncbi:glutathione hydrolase 1 proenzyme-like, partial [Belonocnema kinseyi]|uniref:glutathione hydrolase 1 proenzyme-like n=1 Tax=Belonocnema kinseyi TaxID=2817044 RepID=UPI00143D6BA1
PASQRSGSKAAVAALNQECSKIGVDMLSKNGSAVDAAVATLLCANVVSFHSLSLGGGLMMTIWNATTKSAYFLNAREMASRHAKYDMFKGNESLAQKGGLAVAVPGQLLGLWTAHRRFGKLDWQELFQPAISLCKRGFKMSQYLSEIARDFEEDIRAEPTLAEILLNPKTNDLYKIGDTIRRTVLAMTLEKLSASDGSGVNEFYNGSIAKNLAREIKDYNGIIDEKDFSNYKVAWKNPIKVKFGSMTMYTSPPPGSGALLAFMMNVLEGVDFHQDETILYQYIVETFKWAYARRTELGDPEFEPQVNDLVANVTCKEYAKSIRNTIRKDWTSYDPKFYGAVTENPDSHGTYHTSILAPDGSAVSVTSTINGFFGAVFRSKSTGIIFNNQMDDFSSPNITNHYGVAPSPANFIKPGKRPLSSFSPTIVVDDNNKVRLVIGGTGGTKITTAVALTMISNLWRGHDLKKAVGAPRIHHQLFPMKVQMEEGFSPSVLHYLDSIGHNTTNYLGMGSTVSAIAKENGIITAIADGRRQGGASGF